MLRDIYLYGNLAEKYGNHHRFAVNSASQAAKALAANYKPFYNDFRQGNYRVVIGDLETGSDLDENICNMQLGKTNQIHFIPVAEGSKNGGAIKIIAGLALLTPFALASAGLIGSAAVAAAGSVAAAEIGFMGITYGGLASMGLSFLVSGISMAITPSPKVKDYGARNSPDQRASFLFNGPTNKSAEGTTVPIVYGEFIVGSVLITAGTVIEQIL